MFTIKKYQESCQDEGKGAVLFAVARGNFSEGENFKGSLAKAVFLIGVPKLGIKDPHVILKEKWYYKKIQKK